MSKYALYIDPKPLKLFKTLKKSDQARIDVALLLLAENPIPPKALKLANRDGYRIRVGDFRIIYTFRREVLVIRVLTIAQRREAYL